MCIRDRLINDGLMVVFFFAVGMEIKREVVRGQLSSFRQAILPVVAAAGGMIAPAVVFTLFNHGTPAASGWGIPTATDIAFAVGILSMLERRIPVSLKIDVYKRQVLHGIYGFIALLRFVTFRFYPHSRGGSGRSGASGGYPGFPALVRARSGFGAVQKCRRAVFRAEGQSESIRRRSFGMMTSQPYCSRT